MTDSRPEITAKADETEIVLQLLWMGVKLRLTSQECFALQSQLATAMELVEFARVSADQIPQPTEPDEDGWIEARPVKFREWT